LIDRAIEEDNKERQQARVKKASENTWTTRVEHFWNCARDQGYI
jgi:hypothetical protein